MPGPPRTKTDAERREYKKHYSVLRRTQTVFLGDQIHAWKYLKEKLGAKNNAAIAKILIESFTSSLSSLQDDAFESARLEVMQQRLNESTSLQSADRKPWSKLETEQTPNPPMTGLRYLRNVGTQVIRSKVVNKETQTSIQQRDMDTVRQKFNEMVYGIERQTSAGLDASNDNVMTDLRWNALKTSLGCETNKEMSNILMDWYVHTNPLMQLSGDGQSVTSREATDLALKTTPMVSSSYLLTLRVTQVQEQAIKAMCVLKGWPSKTNSPEYICGPIQNIEYESFPRQAPVLPSGGRNSTAETTQPTHRTPIPDYYRPGTSSFPNSDSDSGAGIENKRKRIANFHSRRETNSETENHVETTVHSIKKGDGNTYDIGAYSDRSNSQSPVSDVEKGNRMSTKNDDISPIPINILRNSSQAANRYSPVPHAEGVIMRNSSPAIDRFSPDPHVQGVIMRNSSQAGRVFSPETRVQGVEPTATSGYHSDTREEESDSDTEYMETDSREAVEKMCRKLKENYKT